jgi:hypothetical protein
VLLPGRLSSALLTCSSLCTRQNVSAPRWLGFFRYPDEFLALRLTGSEFPSLAGSFRCPETGPSLCARQWVSASRWLGCFCRPHQSFALHSTVGECASLTVFLAVLTPLSLCARQNVSAPFRLSLFCRPDRLLALRSTGGECLLPVGPVSPS